MVWGLREPSGFGQFFLDGDYVGFDDRLKDYFSTQMSDAEKAEMGMRERFSYTAFYNKFTKDLGPLKPHECPTEFQVQFNQAKSFGSLVKLTAKLLTVDEALKTIIETLDPGVHQFWPIEIKLPRGKPFPRQFYGLRIGRFLDSFSPEKSDKDAWWERKGRYYAENKTKAYFNRLALSSEAFGDAHLWRETRLQEPEICFSDSLKEAVDDAGLRLPKHYKMKEV